jgi:uncharacterized delta-60 repeat protein
MACAIGEFDQTVLARFNANGTPDNTLDGDGVLITGGPQGRLRGIDVSVDSSGRMVLLANSGTVGTSDYSEAILRFASDGSLDAGYGTGGIARLNGTLNGFAGQTAIDQSGRLLITGGSRDVAGSDILTARLTTTGQVDTTWGNAGYVRTTFGHTVETGRHVAIAPSGNVVVAGEVRVSTPSATLSELGLARYFSATATAAITGSAFNDANNNGTIDSGESPLSGRTIYIDTNDNGAIDSGERTTTTATNGTYTFATLPAGTYRLRQQVPTGWQSLASPSVTLTTGQARTVNLGSRVIPPTTVTATAEFETYQAILLQFSNNLGSSLAKSDITLLRTSVNGGVTSTVTVDPATWTFGAFTSNNVTHARIYPGTPVPDGSYVVRIAANSVTAVGGSSNPSMIQASPVIFLAGDANRDGQVNFSDLVILAQNYNATGKTFSQGNFDYSAGGSVNFADLVLLAQRYGMNLNNVTTSAAVVAAPTKREPVAADVL